MSHEHSVSLDIYISFFNDCLVSYCMHMAIHLINPLSLDVLVVIKIP